VLAAVALIVRTARGAAAIAKIDSALATHFATEDLEVAVQEDAGVTSS